MDLIYDRLSDVFPLIVEELTSYQFYQLSRISKSFTNFLQQSITWTFYRGRIIRDYPIFRQIKVDDPNKTWERFFLLDLTTWSDELEEICEEDRELTDMFRLGVVLVRLGSVELFSTWLPLIREELSSSVAEEALENLIDEAATGPSDQVFVLVCRYMLTNGICLQPVYFLMGMIRKASMERVALFFGEVGDLDSLEDRYIVGAFYDLALNQPKLLGSSRCLPI